MMQETDRDLLLPPATPTKDGTTEEREAALYDEKSRLINEATERMGMGRYQVPTDLKRNFLTDS